MSSRALALQTLLSVSRGRYANLTVDATLRRHDLAEADRGLYTALVYGTLERLTTLEYLLSRHSARPLEELDDTVRYALCLGLYQLAYMDRIPDHAALDETVSLVPRRSAGYVNAVLRAYLRAEAALPRLPDGTRPPRERDLTTPADWIARYPDLAACEADALLAVVYGAPRALVQTLIEALGRERAEGTLAGFCHKPPMTLRVNPARTTKEALAAALEAEGFATAPGLYAPHALRVPDGAITATDAFRDGHFFVQDEASQLCVAALDARPGHVVADTCACPGSKSFGLALDMQDSGCVHAYDLHRSKLSLVESGAQRLGINRLFVAERDARTPDPALVGQCDRVLCDVPCSGLGVIAKKPEIRHKDLSESARLPAIQAAILEASATYLKPGGVLVYSTCTLLPAENEGVTDAFLAAHPEFEPLDFEFAPADPAYAPIRSEGGRVTLYPDLHGTDGFYIAKMRKR